MAHFPPVYSDDESKILIAIYENPDVSFVVDATPDMGAIGCTNASRDLLSALRRSAPLFFK